VGGRAVAGTAVGAGVAAGAQAASITLTSINTETSNLRVFIFSPLVDKITYARIVASRQNKNMTFLAKVGNWSIKYLNLLF